MADAVKEQVALYEARWPAGVEATILGDQSKDIRRMVKDLENNILSGLVLVIAVLMFALGFRNATFVGLAIPFSMFIAGLYGLAVNLAVIVAANQDDQSAGNDG